MYNRVKSFFILGLILTSAFLLFRCYKNSCPSTTEDDLAAGKRPVKLKFAIESLEEMVEKGKPNSGLNMDDIRAAFGERLNYTTWRMLTQQRVVDLFFDLNEYKEENRSPFLDSKFKPKTIVEFEDWYKKLRPYYFKIALLELEEKLKKLREEEEMLYGKNKGTLGDDMLLEQQ